MDLLDEVSLELSMNEDHGQIVWGLEKSRTFATKSLYRLRTNRGVTNLRMQDIWRCKIPLIKAKIFLWRVVEDRIRSVEQFKKRNCKGEVNWDLDSLH